MNILVIGRTIPEKKTGMMGTFEFEQAVAVKKQDNNVIYAFCDLRSIKWSRRIRYVNYHKEDVDVYGFYLPIGGLPISLIRKVRTISFIKLVKKIIKKNGVPDIIHIHFPLLTVDNQIWEFLKNLNIPIVITEHWTKVQTQELTNLNINFLNKIVEESNQFICVSNRLKQSVMELTKTNKNIEVIPNMVSPLFKYHEVNRNNKRFEFITVGRLVNHKRFHLVIDAFCKSFRNHENVHLTIVGDGEMYRKLKHMIDINNMNGRIHMTGFLSREDTAERTKNSNVFVSASILETFGVPVIEAMSCGKTVIVADNSPIKEYISNSTGVLFKADNVDSLANAMKDVYENRSTTNSYDIAVFAEENFSKEAISERLLLTFNNLLIGYDKEAKE